MPAKRPSVSLASLDKKIRETRTEVNELLGAQEALIVVVRSLIAALDRETVVNLLNQLKREAEAERSKPIPVFTPLRHDKARREVLDLLGKTVEQAAAMD